MFKKAFFLFVFCTAFVQAKIYDCFTFYNEVELLEIRLEELDPVVDFFVLVEAKETFKGNNKPLHFEEVKEKFAKFSSKILHVKVSNAYPTDNPWKREAYHRNQIMRALKNCKKEDVILISDADEIVKASAIADLL